MKWTWTLPPFSSSLLPRRQKLCDQTKIGKSCPSWPKATKPRQTWKVLHSPREIFRESLALSHMNRQPCCRLLIGFLPMKKHDKNPYCWGWPFCRTQQEPLLFIMKQTLLRRWPMHGRTLSFRYQQKKNYRLRYPFPPHWIYSRRGMTRPICVHCGDRGSSGGARLRFSMKTSSERSVANNVFAMQLVHWALSLKILIGSSSKHIESAAASPLPRELH